MELLFGHFRRRRYPLFDSTLLVQPPEFGERLGCSAELPAARAACERRYHATSSPGLSATAFSRYGSAS